MTERMLEEPEDAGSDHDVPADLMEIHEAIEADRAGLFTEEDR